MSDIPALYGLVLSGGKSTRMGSDKGLLEYHGVPQREYFYTLLEQFCDEVYLSLRPDQQQEVPQNFNYIVDNDNYRGPFNGILSAHEEFPERAWLVLACDLPLLDRDTLKTLVEERDPKVYATAMATKKTGLPEPLVAIWEPKGLSAAMPYLTLSESSCPRKYMINADIKTVHPREDKLLYNANSLEEYHFAKFQLK